MVLLAFVGLLAAPVPAAAEGDASPYVRLDTDVVGAVRWLREEAARIEASQVLVAFDVTAFAPPPGEHEFVLPDRIDGDLIRWAFMLRDWAHGTEVPVRAASTVGTRSVRMGPVGSAEDLHALVRTPWWEGDAVPRLPKALRWVSWLLDRTAGGENPAAGNGPRMLVLVAGRLPPERWIAPGEMATPGRHDWRHRLLPIGAYFDEAAVAGKVQREGAVLYVVAPEAFFGLHEPYCVLPALPWAARPRRVPATLPGGVAGAGLAFRGSGGAGWAGAWDATGLPLPPNWRLHPGQDEVRLARPDASRYTGAPTAFFAEPCEVLTQADHTPSGYGWWPYARAAAETGGRYVFYPDGERPHLDRPPRDPARLEALAPELISRAAWLKARAGDGAAHFLVTMAEALERVTPWEMGAGTAVHAPDRPWCAFRSLSHRPRLENDLGRQVPRLSPHACLSRSGVERLRTTTLPAYDAALRQLDRLLARIHAGERVQAHPRYVADLRLARVLVAMSAFHLESWLEAVSRLEHPIDISRLRMRMLPVLKLSDCLPAPDGRVLGPQDETRYGRWVPVDALPTYPGNLLDTPPADPEYRALRARAQVFLHLREPLRTRALRLIRVSEDALTHLRGTPWAESVYHDIAYVFEFRSRE